MLCRAITEGSMGGTALLGDIGGTNARFALARDGAIIDGSWRAYANDGYARFEDLLEVVLAEVGPVEAIALSVAGPLLHGDIRMTNRDWIIRAGVLRDHAARVRLLNDLSAHVLAVPGLSDETSRDLRPGTIAGNGQWLAVNLGTGFNAAEGVQTAAGPVALAAERGLCALPAAVAARLRDAGAGVPDCCDAFFSGPGLQRLKAQIGEPAEEVFALCLAELLRELITASLPFDGVYLCGGVAGVVAQGPGFPALLARLDDPYVPYGFLADIPVRLMTGRDAALQGCLAALG